MKTLHFILIIAMVTFISCKKEATANESNKQETIIAENSTETETLGYTIGDYVADFKLKNIDGKMVSLADYSDAKGFIITFTCNTCPYSKMYEDRINALDKKYSSKGYPVIAINSNDVNRRPDDSFEAMQVRAKEKGFTFNYLHDESQDLARTFGATKTPHMYIIQKDDKGNKLVYIGAVDNNSKDADAVTEKYIENAVDELLAGKKITQAETKAIGCTIKWKE